MGHCLDRGVKGTLGLQRLLQELGRPIFTNSVCTLCNVNIDQHSLWLEHLCCQRPDAVNKSVSQVITSLHELDQEVIFANSNLNICSQSYCIVYFFVHAFLYFMLMPFGSCK